ncbi:MAG: asparagine synthase (glutamine-hydrolyzing) [Ignavibacteria bacterium]|nr:asparagine synthase (glutamine-hydrolyzing) [Ignavibacteria bacterium]
MCGFLGAIDFREPVASRLDALRKGLSAIRHRGPDGIKEKTGENYFLGHSRLSIIDLSSLADMPMVSADGKVSVIYNGEIYNYAELKESFRGHQFRTTSDTEVIMEGYIRHGAEFFRQLRGIYSVSILDERNARKVILARDPSGIKPLYIYHDSGFSVFGSEIKALLPSVRNRLTVNESILKCYLNLGYCPEPHTVYNEISTVKPGHVATISIGGYDERRLISYDFGKVNDLSYTANRERTLELLKTAVRRNLVADVEVAVALSGGIDSSLIYALAHDSDSNVKGLTVSFSDKEHDESETASLYAKTVNGTLESVMADSSLDLPTLNCLLANFDQPYADSSAVNVYFLTRASSKFTKVLVGGDGGDELFNGYPSQTWLSYLEMLSRSGIRAGAAKKILTAAASVAGSSAKRIAGRLAGLWSDNPHEMLYDWHSWFPRRSVFGGTSPFLFDPDEGMKLYGRLFSEEAPAEFRNFIVFDYFRKTMLSDYLRKTDMMSMLNGVEYRVPFLDEDLTTFALSIPFTQKSGLGKTKKILRDIHSDIYPSHTSKGAKKGFTIPLDKALTKDDYSEIRSELLGKESISLNYIRKDYVEFLFRMLESREGAEQEISRAGVYQRILMLYSLNLWNRSR